MSIARLGAFTAAAAIFAAGCGNSSSSTTTASPTPAMPAAATTSQMAGSQMAGAPMGSAAPVPTSLHCTDAVVWVNSSKKTYHMSGDPWYGKTKHGEYMCQATAEGKGYHLAGTPHRHTGSNMSGTPTPAPTYT